MKRLLLFLFTHSMNSSYRLWPMILWKSLFISQKKYSLNSLVTSSNLLLKSLIFLLYNFLLYSSHLPYFMKMLIIILCIVIALANLLSPAAVDDAECTAHIFVKFITSFCNYIFYSSFLKNHA